jgi:hypothetical protein
MRKYKIYVPKEQVPHDIIKGSAIVGDTCDCDPERISTHYEGGKYDDKMTFEERLLHAADRRYHKYPTSSFCSWAKNDVEEVAEAYYREDLKCWVIGNITQPEIFQQWLGSEKIPDLHGSEGLKMEKIGNLFNELNRNDQIRIASMTLTPENLIEEVLAAHRRIVSP